MKLEKVEQPYAQMYKAGYIYPDKTGRKMILLVGDSNRLTTAYARYLMSVKLGRFLEKDETVDHIDDDHTNDSIENLQILSRLDNIKKTPRKRQYVHGTRGCYRWGCRCPKCVAVEITYKRHWRELNPDKVRASKERAKTSGTVEKCCAWCHRIFKVHAYDKKRKYCCPSCSSKAIQYNRHHGPIA